MHVENELSFFYVELIWPQLLKERIILSTGQVVIQQIKSVQEFPYI